jgi:CBS domain-containing protein
MEATGFEALLAMGRRGIHHLPVVHEGRLAGVVTQHDLSLLSGANPLALVKDVETAPSLEQLSQIQYSVDLLVENLLRRNLGALGIQSVITLVNDQLMRRLIDISRAELEARGLTEPSLAWAWVGCGSAGRKEQIMRTDHDCAIVYADPPPDRKNETQRYFLALAESVIGGLEQCGFPRCREGNMANNPRWCQSLGVWREYFNTWLTEADQGALRSAALFFDGRIIHGHEELTREIRRHVEGRLLENPSFFRNLAKSALAVIPPLGFFRQFVVEKSGEHENRLNLKKSGLGPLVDATRILTLWRLLPQTNTLDRLMALGENGVIEADLARDAALAFEFMFMLRVKNYIEGPKMDRLSFDWVHPGRLDKVSQKALKEAFRVVSRLQEAVTACLA